MTSTPHTLHIALAICRQLEKRLSLCGVHVALGGSVLHNGQSSKDIDVILYPHKTNYSPSYLASVIESLGYELNSKATGSCPEVLVTHKDGFRVDFFFMFRR